MGHKLSEGEIHAIKTDFRNLVNIDDPDCGRHSHDLHDDYDPDYLSDRRR